MIKKILTILGIATLSVVYPHTISTAQETEKAELNQLASKLNELGFSKCLDEINDITNFVVSKGEHSALLFYDDQKKDESLISFVVGRGGDNQNYLATLDFSQNEECSASYEITQVWIDTCEEVVEAQFKDYSDGQDLHGGFSMLSKGDNLHVAVRVLPEAGCLTVQKEVIF